MALMHRPARFMRSFSYPDAGQRVDGGCTIVVTQGEDLGGPIANTDDADDFVWSDAHTAAFLAGEPLTLRWVSPSPAQRGSNQGAYVCCWVTVDND